jgi:hypothetical protein
MSDLQSPARYSACLAPRGGDEPRERDPRSKTWIWVAIGILVPPLGILMLLVWISHKMTPANAPDDDSKLPPVD